MPITFLNNFHSTVPLLLNLYQLHSLFQTNHISHHDLNTTGLFPSLGLVQNYSLWLAQTFPFHFPCLTWKRSAEWLSHLIQSHLSICCHASCNHFLSFPLRLVHIFNKVLTAFNFCVFQLFTITSLTNNIYRNILILITCQFLHELYTFLRSGD